MASQSEPTLSEKIGSLIPPELLVVLAQAYPLRSSIPGIKDSDREVGAKIGERRVLDFLQSCFEDANSSKD